MWSDSERGRGTEIKLIRSQYTQRWHKFDNAEYSFTFFLHYFTLRTRAFTHFVLRSLFFERVFHYIRLFDITENFHFATVSRTRTAESRISARSIEIRHSMREWIPTQRRSDVYMQRARGIEQSFDVQCCSESCDWQR